MSARRPSVCCRYRLSARRSFTWWSPTRALAPSIYNAPAPFAVGDGYAGSSAGRTLVTSYAQTNANDLLSIGTADNNAIVRNTLDLSDLGASSVKLRYSLQVGGIDASYGASEVSSSWTLGYTNGFGNLVALVGQRSIDALGAVTQVLYRYDGSGGNGVYIGSRFYERFTYNVVINPFETPTPTIFAQSEYLVSEAPGSGGYCGLNFGFGIAPRAPAPKAAFASRSMMASPVGGVPEPASWAMLVAGFGIVGTASRRQTVAA